MFHTTDTLENIIDCSNHPFQETGYAFKLNDTLNRHGVVVLPSFLRKQALEKLIDEATQNKSKAYYTKSTHNVYLTPKDKTLPHSHIFNKQVQSSKGCIATDQIPTSSLLKSLYYDSEFQDFLAKVVGVSRLFPYADPLSEINIHYYNQGQELGWHFDNSSFAITLLLQAPESGGNFEYVPSLRDSGIGDNEYEGVSKVLNGERLVQKLDIRPSSLVIFRGRDCLHRVTKVIGSTNRIIAVFAYNSERGVSLSEEARLTFYGRIGHEKLPEQKH